MQSAVAMTRMRVAKNFPNPSLAKQSFRDECNINTIMKKFEKTGIAEHLNTFKGEYGSFINYEDYHSSLNKILEAKETFFKIPAQIRAKFDNDPSKFLQFTQDPKNHDQMVDMGLANKKEPSEAPKDDKAKKPDIPMSDKDTPSGIAREDPGTPMGKQTKK